MVILRICSVFIFFFPFILFLQLLSSINLVSEQNPDPPSPRFSQIQTTANLSYFSTKPTQPHCPYSFININQTNQREPTQSNIYLTHKPPSKAATPSHARTHHVISYCHRQSETPKKNNNNKKKILYSTLANP